MKPITAVVLGAGSRGEKFAAAHGIPAERCLADAAFVCTLDDAHMEPALKALEATI